MIYSVPDPYLGGFRYFQAPDVTPINDDPPTPNYDKSVRTKVGIPAIAAGRPLPPGAVEAGRGKVPMGAVSSGLPGLWVGSKKASVPSGIAGYSPEGSNWAWYAGAVVGFGALIWGVCYLRRSS